MHPLQVYLIAGLMFFSHFGYAQNIKQTKKKSAAAVMDFQRAGNLHVDEVIELTNQFRLLLVQTNLFSVLERQQMTDILKERNYVMSDFCNSAECLVQIGQVFGVEKMIAGDVGKVGDTYTFDLRMVDVSTGKIVKARSEDYTDKVDGLQNAMKTMVYSFAEINDKTILPIENTASDDKLPKREKELEEKHSSPNKTLQVNKNVPAKNAGIIFLFNFGPSVPIGDMGDYWSSGFGYEFGLGYMTTNRLRAALVIGHASFSSKSFSYSYSLKYIPIMLDYRYNLGDKLNSVYLKGAAGLTKWSTSEVRGKGGVYLTYRAGIGIDYKLSNSMYMGVEGCLNSVSGIHDNSKQINLLIVSSYFF